MTYLLPLDHMLKHRELLADRGIEFAEVGTYGGASTLKNILNLGHLAIALVSNVRPWKPDVAVSHGSRTLTVASTLMRIPSVLFLTANGWK